MFAKFGGRRGGTLELGIERGKIRGLMIWPNNFLGKKVSSVRQIPEILQRLNRQNSAMDQKQSE